MTHRAAVGESKSRDSEAAGREATRAALDQVGGDANALMVFATAGHEQDALLRGIREVAGDVPMAGCSGAGLITDAGSDEGTHAVGVLALRTPSLRFAVLSEQGLSGSAEEIGARLGHAAARMTRPRAMFLFPDGLTGNLTALLRGIGRTAPREMLVFGGAAGELSRFEHTYQYANGALLEDSVVALVVEGDIDFEVTVSHGCKPLGIDHRVTRAEGGTVFEFDGQPAWEVMRDYVDGPKDRFSGSDVPYLCVAQALPEDNPAYGGMIIRVPLRLEPSSGALFFPGELREGELLGMARRDSDDVVARAVECTRELAKRRREPPLFVLHIDCAGRGRLLFGEQVTHKVIAPVQRAFRAEGARGPATAPSGDGAMETAFRAEAARGPATAPSGDGAMETAFRAEAARGPATAPSGDGVDNGSHHGVAWIGFHSYGEIAPVGGQTYYHNYTMALCAAYV